MTVDPRGSGAGGAGPLAYERHKERARQRQREQSASGRDIGELPAVADPQRRARCAATWDTRGSDPEHYRGDWLQRRAAALAGERGADSGGGDAGERDGEAHERGGVAAGTGERGGAAAGAEANGEAANERDGNAGDVEERGLARFCHEYLADVFYLPFAAEHYEFIAQIEQVARDDGLVARAMPRGSGKTALSEAAVLWMLLYGYRRYALLVGATARRAAELLESLVTTLETNERLAADFPEALAALQALERVHNRAAGQTYQGQPTRISFRKDRLVLPTIAGSPASGAILGAVGIGGNIRGRKHKTADGAILRPDVVLVDDPQTEESARSKTQCAARLRKLNGEIPGLARPGRQIACLAAVTVIARDDVADQLLDRQRNPQWHGRRTRFVLRWPDNSKLWDEHRGLWQADHAAGDQRAATAHAFYLANRAALDAGAEVSWPARHGPHEASAIEHAQCLRWKLGEAAFAAEYQNEPLAESAADEQLEAAALLTRLNGLPRRVAPPQATRLTAFIDVQGKALYWLVCGWTEEFSGYVLDYGTEPEQDLAHFSLRNLRRTLAAAAPGAGPEGAIRAGLERLVGRLSGPWRRADGAQVTLDRILIDAGWGDSTDLVFDFCRASRQAAIVTPSLGKGIGPRDKPLREYQPRPGERPGAHWRLSINQRGLRYLTIDTNYWKTFATHRLRTPVGDRGALTLYGRAAEPHRLLAEHLTSEQGVATTAAGRTVTVWEPLPNRDNHWWDCLVGCAAAASFAGTPTPGAAAAPARKRVSWAARQQAARREQG